MRCKECGQERRFEAGDIVQVSLTGTLGLIPDLDIQRQLSGRYGTVPVGWVRYIRLSCGGSFVEQAHRLRVVHGVFRVDKEEQ